MNIMNYCKGQGSEKNWLIEEQSFDNRFLGKCEAVFTQGNGYLGVRHALEEKYINETRNMFVTGTFNKASAEEVTELPNLPDVTNMEIEVNGCRFTLDEGKINAYSRVMNLYTGEVIRHVEWVSPVGEEIHFDFHRFVSMADVHVIGSYVEIMPVTKDTDVKITSGIDARVNNSGAQHCVEGFKRIYEDQYLQYPVSTSQSEIQIAVTAVHQVLCEGKIYTSSHRTVDARRQLNMSYNFHVNKGETVRFEKLALVHTSRDLEYVDIHEQKAKEHVCEDGLSQIKEVAESGYDKLFADSAKEWENIWKEQGITIESTNDYDQLAVRFALYHLQIMVRKNDSRVGIGAKALSGEGYKGHSFWDTETFIFPYFEMAEPEVARTLLTYRYYGLYGARKKAKEQGYEGAMYPWEAAWIDDGEVTPYVLGVNLTTGEELICLTGCIEIHITADIIYALWQYYLATQDEDFMHQYGYEMIVDTARFWNSRMEWVPGKERYEMHDVIGPDEYKEHVDNNAYTNYLAKYNMELAVQILEQLKAGTISIGNSEYQVNDIDELIAQLQDKIEKIYTPMPDAETGIIPQFDGYGNLKEIDLTPYKQASVVGTLYNDYSIEDVQHMQAGKQADVVELLYQLEDMADIDTKRKNYLYYEERTLHDSSLSKAIHSVMACDLDMREEAYSMFVQAASTDLGPEMKSSNAGIHSANMGGVWQDVVMGFGGVRISHGVLRINPHLPEEWQSLSYPIYWHGSRLNVQIIGENVTIENEGETVDAVVNGRNVCIQNGLNQF